MIMKAWILMIGLMLSGMSLNAADFNLYGGRPQSITLRKLVANQIYRWELRSSNTRIMGSGQFKADENGNAELTLELPKLEIGTSVNCKLELPPDKSYGITFYSREPLNELAAALGTAGIYADNDDLKKSVAAVGLVPVEQDKAKIFLLADTAAPTLPALLANGKTVIYFADGDNEINPPIKKMRNFTLETVSYTKKPPALSVLYNKNEFKIGYEGGGGIVDIYYNQGHLVVVAPQLRRELDINPELWLILKHKIAEDLQKWTKK